MSVGLIRLLTKQILVVLEECNINYLLFLQVHMASSFIMNGVCVKWIGWVDLEALSGKARLAFDEEHAKVTNHSLHPRPLNATVSNEV